VRLALRRLAHGEPDARALRNMPEAAGSLCPGVPAGEVLASQARALTETADEMRLGLRRSVYRAQYARALHHVPEGAGGFRRRGVTDLEG